MKPEVDLPVEIYRPDYRVRTPDMQSPEYVQISTAAAITLGLVPGRMSRDACTHCLNILLAYPEGCRANCSYCGLARHREEARDYADRNFIRVDWPTVPWQDLIERVAAGQDQGRFERMCISMITHPRSNDDTMTLLKQWVAALPQIPVSILSNPTTMKCADIQDQFDAGAEIYTVALDAVTAPIFERTRGRTVDSPHRWEHYWKALGWAAEVFGAERFGAHLICGMGETEQELLQVAQQVRDMGGHNHMFAFFPEAGSLMEDWPAVDRGQWRRVQLARYLIDYRNISVSQMLFDQQGRVLDFGVTGSVLDNIIEAGKAFQTSGCPGKSDTEISACNRPYGDSPPSDICSYPNALDRQDIDLVRAQMTDLDGSTLNFSVIE